MFSYTTYKIVHLVGVMMIFLAFGGALTRAIGSFPKAHAWKKGIAITHGLGLLLALLGGFGLLARLGLVQGLPGWAIAKLGIWVLLGGLLALANRAEQFSKILWFALLFLGGLATWLAGTKPF